MPRRRRIAWWVHYVAEDGNLDRVLPRFALNCAPTVLAALTNTTNLEAARRLSLIPKMLGSTFGSVNSETWQEFLAHEFQGTRLDVERPDGSARWRELMDRANARQDDANQGRIYYRDVRVSWKAAHRYTVSQFLRIRSRGTIVLGIHGHTLLAHNGRVIADAIPTKSARGRVRYAIFLNAVPNLVEPHPWQ